MELGKSKSGGLVLRTADAAGQTQPASDCNSEAVVRLVRHAWPGNVRELKNCVERAALLAEDGVIRVEHLAAEVLGGIDGRGRTSDAHDRNSSITVPLGASMEQAEREMIAETLRFTGGNKTRAARILGVSIKTMHNKVKKFAL